MPTLDLVDVPLSKSQCGQIWGTIHYRNTDVTCCCYRMVSFKHPNRGIDSGATSTLQQQWPTKRSTLQVADSIAQIQSKTWLAGKAPINGGFNGKFIGYKIAQHTFCILATKT